MYRTFSAIKEALNSGKSVQEILSYYLQKIEEQQDLNAFLEVFQESATAQAKRIDEKIKAGTAGRLAGMVIGIKDNIAYKNHRVSAASKMLENYVSVYSATVIERLIAEDAIIIGRLNCDEFGMGGSNENSAFGPVKNPINKEYVAGGSSGGSAAAVAANLCTLALGSDTGGSIRQPAAFTGTIGLKPTYGRVSRYGLISYASSFDQVGAIGNALEDVALVTEIMAGKDERDNTSSSQSVPDFTPNSSNQKLKIAVVKEVMETDSLDSEIKKKTEELIQELENKGHQIDYVSFPYIDSVVPTYYVLTTAEASTNLSRFDGVHFGYRSELISEGEDIYTPSRTEGFGEEVKRRIMSGTFVLSRKYYETYYVKAQKVRRLIRDWTNNILSDYDVLMSPTSPTTAFKIGENAGQIERFLRDIYTVQANLSGNPAISIPLGNHSNGLPFGIQLTGKYFKEKELLNAVHIIEHLDS